MCVHSNRPRKIKDVFKVTLPTLILPSDPNVFMEGLEPVPTSTVSF